MVGWQHRVIKVLRNPCSVARRHRPECPPDVHVRKVIVRLAVGPKEEGESDGETMSASKLPRALRPFGNGQYRLLTAALVSRCSASASGWSAPVWQVIELGGSAVRSVDRWRSARAWDWCCRCCSAARRRSDPAAADPADRRIGPRDRAMPRGGARADRHHPDLATGRHRVRAGHRRGVLLPGVRRLAAADPAGRATARRQRHRGRGAPGDACGPPARRLASADGRDCSRRWRFPVASLCADSGCRGAGW